MNNSFQERVLAATYSCLRPLARMLLRSGVDYQQFAEAAKNAFIEEAALEQDPEGKTVNVSRIAIKTGLSRKEVARLRDKRIERIASAKGLASDIEHTGLAARTLQRWHTDPRFLDNKGNPKALDFVSSGVCFSELIRRVGGDVPPGAVRDELIAGASVVEEEDGKLRAVRRHFVPGTVSEDLVVNLAQLVLPVIEGLVRNTTETKSDFRFLQRISYTDRLKDSSLPVVRKMARERCSQFVEQIDDWLTSHEVDDGEPNSERRVEVGVFYFEGSPPGSLVR